MAKRNTPPPKNENLLNVAAYRHEDTRKNLPPAKIAAEGKLDKTPKQTYSYSPRFDPLLRFDDTKRSDIIAKIIADSGSRKLNDKERKTLTDALSQHEPWLEWTGKREQDTLEVDPIALHEHERVSTQAILNVAKRQDVARDLFGDPQLDYHQAVQFYQHDIDWLNRLILGDSLQIMSSLAHREDLAGKVQMIYMDPPYGINYGGNFQINIRKREFGTTEKNVTREIDQIKAYRDTWKMGIHSYFSYLRDRFVLAKELIHESGSIFVQIGEENLPTVSLLLDEVFGRRNRIQIITFKKKSSTQKGHSIADYIIWYGKNKDLTKMPDVFVNRGEAEESYLYNSVELTTGERKRLSQLTQKEQSENARVHYDSYPVVSQLASSKRSAEVVVQGKFVSPGKNRSWSYDPKSGLRRLERAERLRATENSARAIVYWDDGHLGAITNVWDDVHGASNPVYVYSSANM